MFFAVLIVLIPLAITFINIWNLFSKRKIIPKTILCITVLLGIIFYCLYLMASNKISFVEWSQAVYQWEYHTPVSREYLFTFILLCVTGFSSLVILSFVPAKNWTPLFLIFCLSGVLLLNLLNIAIVIQLAPLFFSVNHSLINGLVECEPLLFHLNIIIFSVYYFRKSVLEQIPLMEEKIQKTDNVHLKKMYEFLKITSNWPVMIFAGFVYLLIIIEIILVGFGQGIEAPLKMFTMTADWTLSTQIPPPPLEYQGHYLCTVAAGGHKRIVKPLRFGKRHGVKIIVNRQLMIANAFEELIAEKMPACHKKIRHFYDTHGYPLSKIITTPLRSDIVYILMKPFEWIFLFVLYLLSTNPEERISRQYL